jgi:hypothetical protein
MKKLLPFILILAPFTAAFSQDELMKELEQTQKSDIEYAFQTFKGTRLVNGHTVETKGKGSLEFIFSHRFGAVNGGFYEMFGLDQAHVRLGLDYGITDNLSVSIGRNSYDKTTDGYLKYKLIRQSKGARNFPFTITALTGVAYKISLPLEGGVDYVDRLAYNNQLFIARKVSSVLSLQLMPTFIHRNAVPHEANGQPYEQNDMFAMGVGGRIKLTRSLAITSEYYYRFNAPDNDVLEDDLKRYNALGFGIEIETGGHVFQMVLTNTQAITERAFILESDGNFFAGDIHFGFNITRTFQLKKRK